MPPRRPVSPAEGLPLSPPVELSGGLPETLTEALIASDFDINRVLDEYVAALSRKPASVWQEADYHAGVVVRLILAEHRYAEALEQALVSRIRERLHATT